MTEGCLFDLLLIIVAIHALNRQITGRKCRVVLATNALGMGVNFKGVEIVVRALSPVTNLNVYLQQVGIELVDHVNSQHLSLYIMADRGYNEMMRSIGLCTR